MSKTFSLYVHFPYCSHRCPYCDFNVHVRKDIPEKAFIAALVAEAKFHATQPEWAERKLSSIFLGGGTPSLFTAASIKSLIFEIESLWSLDSQVEISLEANPDNLSEEKLAELRLAGINRLSIGVQSFNDQLLKKLGRNHDSKQAQKSVEAAKKAGFRNINIDLMFSLPEQSLQDLKGDLNTAVRLNTEHISYYSLTIESGTPFYGRLLSSTLSVPSNDQSAAMMEEIIESLSAHGYEQYEISNFSKPGFTCHHNQNYWEGNDYLGIGPGAHSAVSQWEDRTRVSTKRWSNRSSPEPYLDSPVNAKAWSETVSGGSLVFERLLLGLRQVKGLYVGTLQDSLDDQQKSKFFCLIKELVAENLLTYDEALEIIALTKSGRMIADSVTEKFAEALLVK